MNNRSIGITSVTGLTAGKLFFQVIFVCKFEYVSMVGPKYSIPLYPNVLDGIICE
jgi:hypothetical protein